MIEEDGRIPEYIAFHAEQIKSVDNRGTFDPNNPNIFFQSKNNKDRTREVLKAFSDIAAGSSEATIKDLRDDIAQYGGSNDIAFIYGDEKKGLYHIAQRHGLDTLSKVIDAVINGEIDRFVEGNKTLHIVKDGYDAVLSLDENGQRKTWLLTGFEINNKTAGEKGEVSTPSDSTQIKPTFSRQDLVAAVINNIAQKGEKSKGLFKRAADITQTEAFKKWFGDSKVVGAEGRPLVVYHGQDVQRIEIFDNSKGERKRVNLKDVFFFTNNLEAAESYSAEDYITAAYLKIENPYVVDFAGESAAKIGKRTLRPEVLAREIKAEGKHDGIIMKNIKDAAYHDIEGAADNYAVFSSNQIKSVDNRGTFDADDPNIYFQEGEAEHLEEREGGPKISKDLNNIQPFKITKQIKEFDNVKDFRNWVADILENIGTINIRETGQQVEISKSGIRNSLKHKRREGHKEVFAEFKEIFEGAKYKGTRKIQYNEDGTIKKPAQDVFLTAIQLKDKKTGKEVILGVEFYANVLDGKSALNYRGHKIIPASTDAFYTPSNGDINSIPEKGEKGKGLLKRAGDWIEDNANIYFKETSNKIDNLPAIIISKEGIKQEEAQAALSALAGKDIINKSTGIAAQINSKQKSKLVSAKSVSKSIENGFTKEQHFEAASRINESFENAILLEEGADKNNDINIKSIRRFVAPVKLGEDTNYSYMLIKESVEHGNRIYTTELINKKGLESILDTLKNKRTPVSSPNNSIAEKIGKSKGLFKRAADWIEDNANIYFQGAKNNVSYEDIRRKAKMPRTAKTTSEAESIAKAQANKNPHNELLNITGNISNAGIDKMNSASAVKKSISPELHAQALANIDVLFENALFDIIHADKNENPAIKNIHRLGAVMEYADEYYPVKITLKEYADKNTKNKIYSVEAVDIEKMQNKEARRATVENAEKAVSPTPIADFNNSINEILQNVKAYKQKKSKGLLKRAADWIGEKVNVLLQGKRGAYDPATNTIYITPDSDASTMLHEFSHYFLKERWDYILSGRANEAYVKDFEPIKQYLAIEDGQKELTSEQQEKFADAFEAYLAVGEAPSAQLKKAFDALKKWMLRIYGEIKAKLGLELPKEVRNYFAAMLASEAEIEQMNEELAPQIEIEGRTEEEKKAAEFIATAWEKARRMAAQKLFGKKLEAQEDARNQEYFDEEAAFEEKTLEELKKERGYMAAQAIEDFTGEKAKDVQRKYEEGKLAAQEYAQVELTAKAHGFDGIDELMLWVRISPTLYGALDRLTQKHMEEWEAERIKNAEMEENLELAGDDAYLEAMSAELHVIDNAGKKINFNMEAARALAQLAKKLAKEMLSKMPARQAGRGTAYWTRMSNFNKRAALAYKRKDFAKAHEYKNAAILNAAMGRESIRIKKQYEKDTAYIYNVAARDKERFKNQSALNQIGYVLSRLGITRRGYQAAAKRESIYQWRDRLEAQNGDLEIYITDLLDEGRFKFTWDLNRMTTEQIREFVSTIKNMIKATNAEDRMGRDFGYAKVSDTAINLGKVLKETVSEKTRQKNKDKIINKTKSLALFYASL
ncbi:MAG: hypothetical protein LBG46_02215 [Elusimicrobiota bacterium]|jgi:hypothetical protein|nr:hypothetical protein [Elusimicrobiota bacterium]